MPGAWTQGRRGRVGGVSAIGGRLLASARTLSTAPEVLGMLSTARFVEEKMILTGARVVVEEQGRSAPPLWQP